MTAGSKSGQEVLRIVALVEPLQLGRRAGHRPAGVARDGRVQAWRCNCSPPFAGEAVTLVSLQTGEAAPEARWLGHGALDFGPELRTFADTAALVEALDLVITVDTAVAHLAGALGKPVWVLLPFAADWRWLHGRSDSPWYPSARLFRQPSRGEWEPANAQVRDALGAR